jgi:hypothetical protein
MLKINDDIKAHVTDLNPSAGISDFSTVTTFRVASHTMRMAASPRSPYDEQTPRFIVAPRDHLFGFAQMYMRNGKEEVVGSILTGSTKSHNGGYPWLTSNFECSRKLLVARYFLSTSSSTTPFTGSLSFIDSFESRRF